MLKFDSIELNNFSQEEVSQVNMIRYEPNTNFTSVIDTAYFQGQATSDTNKFTLSTQALSIDYDYGIQIVHLNKLYKVNNFVGEKVACGKCFMRQNNQFGYKLSGYSVNNIPHGYDGIMRIAK